jgi:signal transduction histidine kinase/FixJ family two-component response regulator
MPARLLRKGCDAPMAGTAKVLVVDDEEDICDLCVRSLQRYGYDVTATTKPQKSLEMLRQQEFDLLLLDVRMPEISGLEVMRRVRQFAPDLAIVVMTGYASMEMAIEAVKQGATDFLQKPFQNLDNLRLAVAEALAKRDLARERVRSRALMHLVRASEQIASSLEDDVLVQVALRAAMEETGAWRGSVMLYEPGKQVLYLSGAIGLPPEVPLGHAVGLNEGVAGHILKLGEPLLVEDVRSDPRLVGTPRPNQERYQNPSFLAVPIRSGEQVLGVLNLSEKTGVQPFQTSDLEVAGLLGNQLAIALEKAHLFNEIQESYQRLREVDRLKSEFLNIAAHELRTPLSVIMGYAMMLRDDLQGAQQEHAVSIVDSTAQLTRLVDNMTNLRYLEAGGVSLTAHLLYLQEVIPEVMDQFCQKAPDKGLDITWRVPPDLPPVRADQEKVELILGNLLSNASKFTPAQGRIRVWAEAEEDKVVITVEDSGCGIAREEWERIFEPFYQVGESLRREHGGMGLGLTIARELVLLHGGSVWVKSEVGQGSTFCFTLPRADVEASQ